MTSAKGSAMKRASLVVTLAIAASLPAAAASAQTLKTVKDRGTLNCGVTKGLIGFSAPNDQREWFGLDVDMCRALAAAILDDKTKIDFVPLDAAERFQALQSGKIDVLSRNTTWTLTRDTQLGLNFGAVTYYDGQGFMVPKALNKTSAKQLQGATICVQTGTTNEQNVADYFRANKMTYKEVKVYKSADDAREAYQNEICDTFTSDVSQVYAERLKLKAPADHVVLPEVISKEPLATVVRHGDDQWLDIIKWTHYAMLNAEELGVTQKNVDEMLKSTNPEIRRLLGVDGAFGEQLGLTKDWAVRIIRAVGNYGESFDRNIGEDSRLKISRGLNRLWNQGGLQYGPPIR